MYTAELGGAALVATGIILLPEYHAVLPVYGVALVTVQFAAVT